MSSVLESVAAIDSCTQLFCETMRTFASKKSTVDLGTWLHMFMIYCLWFTEIFLVFAIETISITNWLIIGTHLICVNSFTVRRVHGRGQRHWLLLYSVYKHSTSCIHYRWHSTLVLNQDLSRMNDGSLPFLEVILSEVIPNSQKSLGLLSRGTNSFNVVKGSEYNEYSSMPRKV